MAEGTAEGGKGKEMMFDVETKAPKGKFRVVGTDDFPVPPEDWSRDFSTLEEAMAYCKPKPMTSHRVFDDHGECLFTD